MLRLFASRRLQHAAGSLISQEARAMSTISASSTPRRLSPIQGESSSEKPNSQPSSPSPSPSPSSWPSASLPHPSESTVRLGDKLDNLMGSLQASSSKTPALEASQSTLSALALPFTPPPPPELDPLEVSETEKASRRKRNRKGKGEKKEKMSRDVIIAPTRASGGIPNPSPQYMLQSASLPVPLQVPQHLLVVLDLNGTILFRPNRKQPTKFVARPHALRFLEYCIDRFTVVIWSSARPENVNNLIEAIIPPHLRQKVAAIWGRDKFGLTPKDYSLRIQCYKRLTKVWSDPQIAQTHPDYQSGRTWDQTNTVLVDDSFEKARSEPFNLLEIPEFSGDMYEPGEILPQVHDYLNLLSNHSNVSACLRAVPFRALTAPVGPAPGTYH
ncbi:hypothetical protein HYALB_00000366 [Hymenoscyphus albidus]|uniref:Mitochondrial import inner membrane translocase subunit TIM50 n=1 Tax=Hymenoscyphus albidus TaxID=595503 RepID=A0A9N9LKI8_9HELO|nr:hypothetical protein HYALB_00000366 [Hymenoscyphus albidus]